MSIISAQTGLPVRDPIEVLLEHNRDIRAAELALEAATEKVRSVGVLPDPKFETATFIEPVETRNGPMEAQIMLGQKFPLWGKLHRQRQVAVERAEIAGLNLEGTQVMAAFQLRRDWEKYRKFTRSLEILDNYRAELESFRNTALSQYSTGKGLTQHPILKLQIEISLVESQINMMQSNLDGAINSLQSLFDGAFSPELFGGQRTALPPADSAEIWLDRARAGHPMYLMAGRKVRIAELEHELATRKNYPDLMAGFTYTAIGDGDPMADNPGGDALGFKVGLNLPLWMGRNKARVRATELMVNSREESALAVWNGIEDQIRSTRKEWAESEETYTLYNDQLLQESAQMLSSAFAAYETGKISFLDVLDSERMVVRVRLQFEAMEAQRRIAGAKLLKDSGLVRLSEDNENEN
ncbi:MAG: TolC family protein [Candidatus Neomarinimicrobiota bacterium]